MNQIGLLQCICGQCLNHPKDPQEVLLVLLPIINSMLDVIATATDKGIEMQALPLHLQIIGVVPPLGLVLHLLLEIGREVHLGQVPAHLQVPVLGLEALR